MTRSLASCFLALALAACASDDDATDESTVTTCSNGRDDDGDGAIDCADVACRAYVFCLGTDGGTDAGPVDAAPRPDGSLCARPIDVVLSVDVSSSMEAEITALREASGELDARLRALDPEARVSLVVFVDDALAISSCGALSAQEMTRELDLWRATTRENRSPVSGTYNQDCAENSLDALALAASCPWRDGSARVVVHVTDDTFAERPAVLSGPYGGGIVVQHTYDEVGDALVAKNVRVVAVTRTGQGKSCGAGRSDDVGRGFDAAYDGMPSLPDRTRGIALSLPELVDGRLDLAAEVAAIAGAACAP